MMDLAAETSNFDLPTVTRLQQLKTGALIAFSVEAGAILARIPPEGRTALRAYARENMHPSVEIELVAVDRIARGPGGKLDPFISQVSGADIEVHPR